MPLVLFCSVTFQNAPRDHYRWNSHERYHNIFEAHYQALKWYSRCCWNPFCWGHFKHNSVPDKCHRGGEHGQLPVIITCSHDFRMRRNTRKSLFGLWKTSMEWSMLFSSAISSRSRREAFLQLCWMSLEISHSTHLVRNIENCVNIVGPEPFARLTHFFKCKMRETRSRIFSASGK